MKRPRVTAALAVAGTLLALAAPLPAATPGVAATPAGDGLRARLQAALAAQGPGYLPRTRHRRPDGAPKYTNRLILEPSPYLLQHAHNPVDWYPWCDEAFERARRENKPVFLSVGYSTCHWCHVMEEESFEDEEIAAYLNANYVAVKVDRESRPDVDAVYMDAVQLFTGGGGWPMTAWLTADREPFYAGTYFPARDGDRGVRVGLRTLLETLAKAYREHPERAAATAAEAVKSLRAQAAPEAATSLPQAAALRAAYEELRRRFDSANGGFGRAPKFPRSVELEFLLRYHRRTGEKPALDMATQTLRAMAAGGVYDHVGGGFHRYATDARWLVPHFEKMLYDNALLAVAYLEAFQVTADADFARIAREILAYLERDMAAPEGGFYSASDADSEGKEGTYYVWTRGEISAALAPAQARLALAHYAVRQPGDFGGRNILHTPQALSATAAALGLDAGAVTALLQHARAGLLEARRKRVAPHTDRKVLTSWNGLAVSAFARATQVLGDDRYADVATRSAEFLLAKLNSGGRLRHAWFDARAVGDGFLDDYAFLVAGLLDLYETRFDLRYLEEAKALQRTLDERFRDPAGGGYFLAPDDGERLPARRKPNYDGAEPSGNSVAVQNLLRLHEFTADDRYRRGADEALKAFGGPLARAPVAVPRLLSGLDFRLDRPKEIVVVAPGGGTANAAAEAQAFLAAMRRAFVPNRVVSVVAEGADLDAAAATLPWLKGKTARGGKTTAYVCERRVCALPTSDPAVFARQLEKVEPLRFE